MFFNDHLVLSGVKVTEPARSIYLCAFKLTLLDGIRKDAQLFGESASRVLISVKPGRYETLLNQLQAQSIIFTDPGQVTAGELTIDGQSFGHISSWAHTYNSQLGEYIDQ